MTGSDKPKPLLKRVLRPLIPERLLAERAIYHRLDGKAGRTYLKLRILDWAGMGASNRRKVPPGTKSFLFVCFGNIMRSPMAERMLKRALAENAIEGPLVKSAGIHAVPGTEAHPRAQVAARELSMPLDDHRSQLLTPQMADAADAIFAMDFQNKAELLTSFPQAEKKIFMLGAYAGARDCEIPDPYFGDQDEARRCYRVLQTCIDNLVASLWLDLPETAQVHRSQLVSSHL